MILRQVLCHVRLKKVKATRMKVLVFVHLMALSVIYFSFHQVNEISRVFRTKSPPKLNNDEKVILYWTKYFGMDDFSVGFGHRPFRHCPVSNCRTTNDRTQLDQSDAVVFHIRDIDLEDLPSLRFPHQRWIFYLLESPIHTPSTIDYLDNKFNWTMTYRTDSDVQSPYGLPQSMIADRVWAESYERAKGTFNRRLTNLLSKKNNTIAWVVSHCNTSSGREKYVDELKQYINVDIYGQCSDQNCSSSCFETLGQQYKFYLSFENSLCRDYVTEKFYNPLFYNMIPIVYGSADYSRIPELGSAYIDTRNFVSVKDLADYLHYLDKNERAYQKYFKWRRKPAGLSVLPRTETAWCNLCQKLVQSSTKSLSIYRDMYEWWDKQANCKRDDVLLEQT